MKEYWLISVEDSQIHDVEESLNKAPKDNWKVICFDPHRFCYVLERERVFMPNNTIDPKDSRKIIFDSLSHSYITGNL